VSIVEILETETAAPGQRLRAFALDGPRQGSRGETFLVDIHGWALGRHVPAIGVQVAADDGLLRRAAIEHPRPDVAAAYPGAPRAERSGFRIPVSVLGLRPEFDLRLRAILADDSSVRLARIRGRWRPLRTGFEPVLWPLMMTCIGRTGSTWVMRLLAEHPAIVAHRVYPYELRIARYWLHMLKVLTEPADHFHSGHPDYFQNERAWVGHNPFYPEPLGRSKRLDEWLGRTYVEELAAFCQRSIDECYRRIAADQGEEGALFFAEKHRPDTLPSMVWQLYPDARELILVRDFRDVICSALSFNERRGRVAFGRQHVETDAEFVRQVARGRVRNLLESWYERRDRAHLVRYEDIVLSPIEAIGAMLRALDLEHDRATIEGMIERASQPTPELDRHQTSDDPERSIGRWRTDLAPDLQEVCREELGGTLEAFGYEV
jgi:hypothetical protein